MIRDQWIQDLLYNKQMPFLSIADSETHTQHLNNQFIDSLRFMSAFIVIFFQPANADFSPGAATW